MRRCLLARSALKAFLADESVGKVVRPFCPPTIFSDTTIQFLFAYLAGATRIATVPERVAVELV